MEAQEVSTFKGTPGPWRGNDGNEVVADRESHELLFMAPHNMCATCAINTQLAAAAPDLLAAATRALSYNMYGQCLRDRVGASKRDDCHCIHCDLSAAIAKALGGAS